jgi:hypothetical protein
VDHLDGAETPNEVDFDIDETDSHVHPGGYECSPRFSPKATAADYDEEEVVDDDEDDEVEESETSDESEAGEKTDQDSLHPAQFIDNVIARELEHGMCGCACLNVCEWSPTFYFLLYFFSTFI